jgi:hypothetical protein
MTFRGNDAKCETESLATALRLLLDTVILRNIAAILRKLG